MANTRKKRNAEDESFELVGVRLPTALVAKLDDRLEDMKHETPGVKIHRADVIRNILVTALDESKR